MEWIKVLFDRFESFFKRAFLPSMVFWFFIVFLGLLCNCKFESINEILGYDNFIIVLFILSIGYSYFVNMLVQLIFDNNIKQNYNTFCFWTDENKVLNVLRKKVIEKIKKEKIFLQNPDLENIFNDYFLYQLLEVQINTKRYVDDAKSYGVIVISLLLSSFFLGIVYKSGCLIFMSVIAFFGFFIGFEAIKAKYRARAVRLYCNYLGKGEK